MGRAAAHNSYPAYVRRCITLIEVMIVLGIIGMIAGLMSFNINRAMADQRFKTESGLVLDILRMAQNLMLILNEDIHVKFAQDKQSLKLMYWMEMSCSISKQWDKQLPLTPRFLSSIQRIDLLNGENSETTNENQLDLKFLSGGTVMSSGILRLSAASGGDNQRYICLKGVPNPISATTVPPSGFNCNSMQDLDFIDQLTQFTINEITLKIQQINQQQPGVPTPEQPLGQPGAPAQPTTPSTNGP